MNADMTIQLTKSQALHIMNLMIYSIDHQADIDIRVCGLTHKWIICDRASKLYPKIAREVDLINELYEMLKS